jgi:hypothetical protein
MPLPALLYAQVVKQMRRRRLVAVQHRIVFGTKAASAKLWRPCTPAMAAGLTDHVWSLREVLRLRVPPWPQPQTV